MSDTLYLPPSDANALLTAANRLIAGRSGALGMFFGDANHPELSDVAALQGALDAPAFGGIFPGLIHEGKVIDHGVLLVFFPDAGEPVLVKHLDQPECQWPATEMLSTCRSALIIPDGHSAHIGAFLASAYHIGGHGVTYLGGGAGSLAEPGMASVFAGDEACSRSAVIVPMGRRCGLGVRHGWQVLFGPLLASRTRGNIIDELNWMPAMDVYRQHVEPDAGVPLDADNFFDVAKGYPFGIYRADAEYVVRDPMRVDPDGALVCVAEVPQNTTLSLLRGEPDTLLEAARLSAQDALENVGGKADDVLIFDCISRAIFLDKQFQQELDAVTGLAAAAGVSAPPSGMLTLGEIASSRTGIPDFLNKTIVVGAFHD